MKKMRSRVNKRVDRRVFRKTAGVSAINLKSSMQRGGTRL